MKEGENRRYRESYNILKNTFYSLLWIVVLWASLLPHASPAQEIRLNAHTLSWHPTKVHLNDQTWGGGVEVTWQNGSWQYGFLGGSYHNSHWNQALYLGLSGSYSITKEAHVGIGLAGATGYEFFGVICLDMPLDRNGAKRCFRPDWIRLVMPMVWPFVSLGNRIQLRVLGSPLMGGVGHLMVSLRLN